jgi:hypothetical protein
MMYLLSKLRYPWQRSHGEGLQRTCHRGPSWRKLSLVPVVPVVLASVAGAALTMPQDRALLGQFLKTVAIPYEIGLVTWIALRVWRSTRRTRGTDDMAERLREVAREVFPARRVADMLAFEIAVLYYSLFSWRAQPRETGGEAFTYHRKSGYGALLFALAIVTAAEVTPVHLLLARWSGVAAWTVTALSLYGMLWFVADWRTTPRGSRPRSGTPEAPERGGISGLAEPAGVVDVAVHLLQACIGIVVAARREHEHAAARPIAVALRGAADLGVRLRSEVRRGLFARGTIGMVLRGAVAIAAEAPWRGRFDARRETESHRGGAKDTQESEETLHRWNLLSLGDTSAPSM